MDSSIKNIIKTIGVIIAIGLIAWIVWFFLLPKKVEIPAISGKKDVPIITANQPQRQTKLVRKKQEQQYSTEDAAKLVARSFIERWYSYSSDNQGLNFKLLKESATAQMRNVLEEKIIALKSSQGFMSSLGEVVSLQIEMSDNETASTIAIVRLTEESASGKTESYKKITVLLKKIEGKWLADAIQEGEVF